MKFFAIICLLSLLSFTAASQTTTKPAAKQKAASAKSKPADTKKKAAAAKPKPAPEPTPVPELSVADLAAAGYEKLQAGDLTAAGGLFRQAVAKAPVPVDDTVFNDTLAKFPANLYFRGSRDAAIGIAKLLEEKASANARQLLSLAAFYLSIENGSEAKRLAQSAIAIDPNSPAAYETLGLANRVDFQLEESAAAYSKALELAPDSLTARRGLAEMKRSLGKPAEAISLYREILDRDSTVIPAQTGLVLAMFDAGDHTGAEAELARSLEANPGNVILLAGAAYWYAAHRDGEKAIDLAQKAIAADPRFIWSHIALARGYLSRNRPDDAEKTLLAARRYGNFPTLEYEIASARLAAGYYREAAEELGKSFSINDGMIAANLGGRVPRQSRDFAELIGFERRASIFAPTAADAPESAVRLMSLLELKQETEKSEANADAAARAANAFITGDDPMKVHRQIYAAAQLLEKKIALPSVIEIARAASANIDAGIAVPNASMAVMASELYESRTIAAVRGEYINVPAVPRPTLSSIVRGRIEELTGWALYQMSDADEAVLRLKRAVSVLPPDSAWWRSSTWHLGAALALAGKDAEALDMYIKSYKSSGQGEFRYGIIADLYKRVHGSTDGLEERIGPDPAVAMATPYPVKTEEPVPAAPLAAATPEATPAVAIRIPAAERPIPAAVPVATVRPAEPESVPAADPLPSPEAVSPENTPEAAPLPTPSPEGSVPEPTPEPSRVIEAASPEPTPEPTPESTPEAAPAESVPDVTPGSSPAAPITDPGATVDPVATPEPTPEPKPAESVNIPEPAASPEPTPITEPRVITTQTPASPEPDTSEAVKQIEPVGVKLQAKTSLTGNELFPPVVITIPPPPPRVKRVKETDATPEPSPTPAEAEQTRPAHVEPKPEEKADPGENQQRSVEENAGAPVVEPCRLTVSEESIRLQTGGGDIAVIVGLDDDGPIDGLTAVSTSPDDVSVRREHIEGVTTRALFVLRSISPKTGVYQVRFEMPCGKREIVVRVR